MNTPKLLSITAILALALTSASTNAATAAPKQDVITFKDPKAVYKTGGTIALATAFAATSKAALTFTTSTPDLISISGTTATIKKAGTATITAVYPATTPAGFIKAADLTQSVVIAKAAAPKITVTDSGKGKYTYAPNTSFTVSVAGLPSDYYASTATTYSSTGPVSINNSGTGALTGAGAATVAVTVGASPNYITPAAVTLKLAVAVGTATPQSISISSVAYAANGTVTIPTPALTPSDATGGTWTFTTTAKTAKISGSTITIIGAGNVDILAAWSGNANYAKTAKPVLVGTLTVNKANDSIIKTPITAPAPGASLTLPALKSAGGQPVVFSGTGVAGGKVTPSGASGGSTVVTGTTVASANFNAATPITYTVGWTYNSTTKAYTFSAQ